MKTEQKALALQLRINKQYSIKQLMAATGLSKGTLSLLTRDYPLSRSRILELNQPAQMIGAAANKAKALKRHQLAKEYGTRLLDNPKYRDLCFLYWGEGDKSESSKRFRISNSDYRMVKYIDSVLSEIYPSNKIEIAVYSHKENNTHDVEIRNFWKSILGRDIDKLYRVSTSRASQRKRVDKLPYGTVSLSIHSVDVFYNMIGAINSITLGL